jgi:hypothetical protein
MQMKKILEVRLLNGVGYCVGHIVSGQEINYIVEESDENGDSIFKLFNNHNRFFAYIPYHAVSVIIFDMVS